MRSRGTRPNSKPPTTDGIILRKYLTYMTMITDLIYMEIWHVQTKNNVFSRKSRKKCSHRVHVFANLMKRSDFDGLIRPPAFYLCTLIWYGQPYLNIKKKSTEFFYPKSMVNASVRRNETCRRKRGL